MTDMSHTYCKREEGVHCPVITTCFWVLGHDSRRISVVDITLMS